MADSSSALEAKSESVFEIPARGSSMMRWIVRGRQVFCNACNAWISTHPRSSRSSCYVLCLPCGYLRMTAHCYSEAFAPTMSQNEPLSAEERWTQCKVAFWCASGAMGGHREYIHKYMRTYIHTYIHTYNTDIYTTCACPSVGYFCMSGNSFSRGNPRPQLDVTSPKNCDLAMNGNSFSRGEPPTSASCHESLTVRFF